MKVTPAAEGQKTLTCITTCPLTDNPTYIWYKNGQNVQDNSSPMYSISSEDADSYYCAVKGHDGLSSPAVCEYSTIVPYSTQQVSCIQAKEKGLTLSIITEQKYIFLLLLI